MRDASFSSNIIKIRFIVSNHMLYNTPEKLLNIMENIGISAEEFDIACEPWYKTNNWWDDPFFINAMDVCGIDNKKKINIK